MASTHLNQTRINVPKVTTAPRVQPFLTLVLRFVICIQIEGEG